MYLIKKFECVIEDPEKPSGVKDIGFTNDPDEAIAALSSLNEFQIEVDGVNYPYYEAVELPEL